MTDEFIFPDTKKYLISCLEDCFYATTFYPSITYDEYCDEFECFEDCIRTCKQIDPKQEYIDYDFSESGFQIHIKKFQNSVVELTQTEYDDIVLFISAYFQNKILIEKIGENNEN